MELICGSGNQSLLPCVNSLNCTVTNGLNQCICKPGFSWDFIGYGHIPNCLIPETFLQSFFVVYTVCTFVFLILALINLCRSDVSGKIRKLAIFAMTWAFDVYLHVLAVYSQDGFYEGAIITLFLVHAFGFLSTFIVSPLLLKPLENYFKKPSFVERYLICNQIFACAHLLIEIIGCTFLIIHCRDVNPTFYNRITIVLILENVPAIMTEVCSNLYFALKLRKVIEHYSTSLPHISKQLNAMIIFLGFLFLYALLLLVATITWAVFSSFNMWIVWMIQNWVFFSIYPLTFLLLNHYQSGVNMKNHDHLQSNNLNNDESLKSVEDTVLSSSMEIITPLNLGMKLQYLKKAKPRFQRRFLSKITEEKTMNLQHQQQQLSKVDDGDQL